MKVGAPGSFGAHLKALREAAGYTQEELATIAGLSVHAVSALERGERRRPHVETVRALSAALDLTGPTRDTLLTSARAPAHATAVDELSHVALPLPPTVLLGRETDVRTLQHWLADPAARLITLIGPGGVGKTRLALELARAIADEGATRVVFVPLAAIRNPEFVASAIAEALGLSDVTALDLPRGARVACERSPDVAGARQFRAAVGRSAAGRGSPDLSHDVAPAGHQSRAASRAGRTGVRARTARVGGGVRADVARRSGARPRGAALRANGFGTCTLAFSLPLRTAPP